MTDDSKSASAVSVSVPASSSLWGTDIGKLTATGWQGPKGPVAVATVDETSVPAPVVSVSHAAPKPQQIAHKTLVTTTLGNNDLARVFPVKLPGTDRGFQDGGQTSQVGFTAQRGPWVGGVDLSHYTAHDAYISGGDLQRNERDAVGVWSLHAGRVWQPQSLLTGTSTLAYGRVSASYNDTGVAGDLHQFVHNHIVSGRNVRAEYDSSKAKLGLNVSALAAVQLEKKGWEARGVTIQPLVQAAAELGTDRSSASLGAGVTVGRHPQNVPLPLPRSNPEGLNVPFVAAGEMEPGAFAVRAVATRYYIGQNPYLQGDVTTANTVNGVMVAAGVALSRNVSLQASYDTYESPSQRLLNVPLQGPKDNSTLRAGFTVRF